MDATQCCVKLKLRQKAYQKTREANGRSFSAGLIPFWGGAATTTPPLSMDSEAEIFSTLSEDFADGEDEEDEELGESTQHTVFPDSQDLFITRTEINSQPNEAGEGNSALQDKKAAVENGPQCFRNMLLLLGIEAAIESLIKSVGMEK
ncbi:Centromere protein P [Chelonia mydas]|uniref:Centromere protein P n=1 Tax=Chelonia mydas TaxID=8469 RepID=M7BPA5_CHEMY|nr:Centromere protein P [Chelonia mydas]